MEDPIRRMIRITYYCAGALALMILCLSFLHIPIPGQESYFAFYADFILKESKNWLGYAAIFILLGGVAVSLVRSTRELAGKHSQKMDGDGEAMIGRGNRVSRGVLELLRVVFPIVLNLVLFSYVVGYVNAVNRGRLIDTKLASIDFWLTGTYPFLSLEMIQFPAWLIETTAFSFLNLPSFMVLIAVVTFFKDRKVFSKYVVAFFTSIILMIPLWLLVPVMSPQDRFIDNVYHLEDPPRMAAALKEFAPVPEVETFLSQMRKSKEGLDIMPTTTFPSSHAAWATIALIFIVETSVLAGSFFAPFLLLSTLGTFYFAQHYLVDTPAGILIGILSAIIAWRLFSESRDRSPGTDGHQTRTTTRLRSFFRAR